MLKSFQEFIDRGEECESELLYGRQFSKNPYSEANKYPKQLSKLKSSLQQNSQSTLRQNELLSILHINSSADSNLLANQSLEDMAPYEQHILQQNKKQQSFRTQDGSIQVLQSDLPVQTSQDSSQMVQTKAVGVLKREQKGYKDFSPEIGDRYERLYRDHFRNQEKKEEQRAESLERQLEREQLLQSKPSLCHMSIKIADSLRKSLSHSRIQLENQQTVPLGDFLLFSEEWSRLKDKKIEQLKQKYDPISKPTVLEELATRKKHKKLPKDYQDPVKAFQARSTSDYNLRKKQELEQKHTVPLQSKPQINQKSKNMLRNKREGRVEDRLISQSQEFKVSRAFREQMAKEKEEAPTFKPHLVANNKKYWQKQTIEDKESSDKVKKELGACGQLYLKGLGSMIQKEQKQIDHQQVLEKQQRKPWINNQSHAIASKLEQEGNRKPLYEPKKIKTETEKRPRETPEEYEIRLVNEHKVHAFVKRNYQHEMENRKTRQIQKRLQSQLEQVEDLFKPQISENSQKIVQKEGREHIHTTLYQYAFEQVQKKAQKALERKQEIEQKEMKEVTFKPQLGVKQQLQKENSNSNIKRREKKNSKSSNYLDKFLSQKQPLKDQDKSDKVSSRSYTEKFLSTLKKEIQVEIIDESIREESKLSDKCEEQKQLSAKAKDFDSNPFSKENEEKRTSMRSQHLRNSMLMPQMDVVRSSSISNQTNLLDFNEEKFMEDREDPVKEAKKVISDFDAVVSQLKDCYSSGSKEQKLDLSQKDNLIEGQVAQSETSPQVTANVQYMQVTEEVVSDFKGDQPEVQHNRSLSLIEEDANEEDEPEIRDQVIQEEEEGEHEQNQSQEEDQPDFDIQTVQRQLPTQPSETQLQVQEFQTEPEKLEEAQHLETNEDQVSAQQEYFQQVEEEEKESEDLVPEKNHDLQDGRDEELHFQSLNSDARSSRKTSHQYSEGIEEIKEEINLQQEKKPQENVIELSQEEKEEEEIKQESQDQEDKYRKEEEEVEAAEVEEEDFKNPCQIFRALDKQEEELSQVLQALY